VLVSISNSEGNLPRIPKTRDVMKSYSRPLTTWGLADLEVDAEAVRSGSSYYEVAEIFIPEQEIRCEFVSGDSPDEKTSEFARRVAEVMSTVS